MTTIMGPTPCRDCKAPVSVVTRTVEVPCGRCQCGCVTVPRIEPKMHTHAIPDVAWTVVDADGERHLCPVDTARYDAGSEEARVTGGPSDAISWSDPVRVL
jgi:hypothetical protein